MQNNFFVSVIIPVYNSEKYIARCLRSLKYQSLDRRLFEIIVIDDFSKDNSLKEIIKYADINLKIIKNSYHLGLPKSLNKGILSSIGTLIVRVDSDDWVHKDFLNILSTFLYLNKNLDAVACDYTLTDDKERGLSDQDCTKKPIGCGIMFRIQQLLEIGMYNEKFRFAEEEAFRYKFLKKYTITRVPLSLYRYRQHKNNMSKNQKMIKFFRKKIKKY